MTILLSRRISYELSGPLTLTASITGGADPLTGDPLTVERTLEIPQPSPWTTDADVLRAVAAQFPAADVTWAPLPAPPVEVPTDPIQRPD